MLKNNKKTHKTNEQTRTKNQIKKNTFQKQKQIEIKPQRHYKETIDE